MRQYIYAWITVAVLATLSEMMIPGGRQGKTAGHFRFVAGLCVLIAMLPTVKEGLSRLYSVADGSYELMLPSDEAYDQNYEAFFSDHMEAITREQYEVWVYDALLREFSLPEDEVMAVIQMQETEGIPCLASVEICLFGTGILQNPHLIKDYVEAQLSVPCTVSVGLS